MDAVVYYDFDPHWRMSVNMGNQTDARYVEQPIKQFNNAPGATFSVLAILTAGM